MNPVLAADITLPHINYGAIAPILILLGMACVGVLAEAFLPRTLRYPVQVLVSLVAQVAGLATIIGLALSNYAKKPTLTAGDALAVDGPGLFLQGAVLVLGIVATLLIAERSVERGGAFVAQAAVTAGSEADAEQARRQPSQTEIFPLSLFALGGMMLFVSANDLLTMFVALEVFSLPLYLMCALARRRRLLSQEAAVKYFLLGAFSSAFFVYGIAMLYGFAGSVKFHDIAVAAISSGKSDLLMFIGLAMLAIGLLFKAAAVPFHVWTPDVYQGAPTPVTALMASCTKVAAFGGILRIFYVAFLDSRWDWRPVIGVIAVLTMVIGAILAVTQTDIKRLLAYSSIANAGYVLTGVLAMQKDGISSSLFYLVTYGFTVLAAFGLVTLVRDQDGEATHLSRWAGLGRKAPVLAGVFTFLMLSFAGIPLTSGFTGKFAVFSAALGGGQTTLVIFGVLSSVLLAFPYLRVVVLMYLQEPAADAPTVAVPGALTSAALAIGAIVTLLLGVWPSVLLDVANSAAQFVG
ncbi:NADH-quinone oxidoreductase subunit NuoN [Actinocatenispora rupis]|uniref:NADH-quinone oxidoreductase subunit N n=1 Tax=Actinocatenispora rupis TaxID=519421 RepID=A0A8J3JGU9_9ACTN|nr:NADH-quinone oxidoreductase subunit NuoN [Actinocatenispora rupis]GID15658.1 NADH-quinone oxidoreductase subunit N [Actinocatenispora rupis]